MTFLYQILLGQAAATVISAAYAKSKTNQSKEATETAQAEENFSLTPEPHYTGIPQRGVTTFEEITLYQSTSKQLSYACDDIPEGIRFPPGHPVPAGIYREHPFRKKMFLPAESYDRVLFEEREAELIKFLVDLGATKVIIDERNASEEGTEARLDAQATAVVDAGYQQTKRSKGSGSRSRTIDLGARKDFHRGRLEEIQGRLDTYRWLDWEPSWQSLLYARVYGHCLSSEVELSFSKDTIGLAGASIGIDLLKLGVPASIGNIGAEIQRELRNQFETKLLFRVWFAEIPEGSS